MSCSLNFQCPKAKALPPLPLSYSSPNQLNHRRPVFVSCDKKACASINTNKVQAKILGLGTQIAGLLAAPLPALAVTGVNDEEDLVWTLIQLGISAFFYFIVFPPIIMNWLRIRWYRRNLLEMYLQFMSVFLFFPGVLLWAPFLNFRKFPRDPSMKYPWSTPENPSAIKGGFSKYPWATPEDYE